MARNYDPRLEMSAVRSRYNDPTRYSKVDSWHLYTAAEIRRVISHHWDSLPTKDDHKVLNAGAGDNDLGLCPPNSINLDISETRISSLPNPLVASIEAIPLDDATIDTVICVGSVINYCDAAVAISELGRVTRSSGYLLLEFESSLSAELITQKAFGQSAAISNTFYANQKEVVWVFSPTYIKNLLYASKFVIVRSIPIHILSPWTLLLLRSIGVSAAIAHLDRMVRRIPPLTLWASNHLFFCEKRI